MKKVFDKIVSLFLALIVVLSTVSFTVDSHYCDDALVDATFFGNIETCGMEEQQHKAFSSASDLTNKNCCRDEQLIVAGQDICKTTSDSSHDDQQLFTIAFINTCLHSYFKPKAGSDSYKDYKPPLIVRDIHLVDQTFLI